MKYNQKLNELKNKPENEQVAEIMEELTDIEMKIRQLIGMMKVTKIRDFHTMLYKIKELLNKDFSKYHKRSFNEFVARNEQNK